MQCVCRLGGENFHAALQKIAVVIGADELAKNCAKIKNLASGEEREVAIAEVAAQLGR